MDLGLQDKVAIITGGGSGIGRIIAHILAEEGANIVIADLNKDGADKVAQEVQERGVDSLAVKTDVSRLEETDKLVKSTLDRFGRVDILVHGAVFFNIQPFMKTSPEVWEKVVKVAQFGAMNCARSVLEHMTAAKYGRIIYIGSDAGRVGDPYQSIYAGAKGGIVAFSKSIAQDVGRFGITVNVVSPALVETEENREVLKTMYGMGDEKQAKKLLSAYPLRRIGTSEDIAYMVAFLASDKAGDITGQTISVNGGYCMV